MSTAVEGIEAQDKILSVLYKYGESFLEKKNTKGKKSPKQVQSRDGDSQIATETYKNKMKKRKRKNKKKKIEMNHDDIWSEEDDASEDNPSQSLTSEQKHIEDIKYKLGLTSKDFQKAISVTEHKNESEQTGPNSGRKRREPEIVVFQDPAKRNKMQHDEGKLGNTHPINKTKISMQKLEKKDSQYDSDTFDMKNAKFDVMMLGIKGLEKTDREKARVDVAIRLGAKPPKNQYMNYKELQEKKKREKEEEKIKTQEGQHTGELISKSNQRKRRKRDANDIGFVDGQIGQYKSGVQVLKKTDLTSLRTGSRRNQQRSQNRAERGRGGRR